MEAVWGCFASMRCAVLKKRERERESYGVECHFQQYFSYIMEVKFVDGIFVVPEKNTDLRKSLTNFIT
jgi:hypothetical protein